MTTADIELALHRLGTQQFIAAKPTIITLQNSGSQMYHGTRVAGGLVTRDPQTFKIIWAYDNGVYRQIGAETDDPGGARRFDFIIVGTYDATVAIGDFWKSEDEKQEYRIEYVFPSNGYEVKAGGVSHGPEPG